MLSDNAFSSLDNAFAKFLSARCTLNTHQKIIFQQLIKNLSAVQSLGHNCLMIHDDADKKILLDSGVVLDINAALKTPKPLVLEANRLYLQRYWDYEYQLALQLKSMAQQQNTVQDIENLLDKYFEKQESINWQRIAAQYAMTQRLTIITGGPGTGKTTTVVKILALLQETSTQPLLIALAAPTGKAAMRLQESINNNKAQLNCSDRIKQLIPHEVTTLHRLLGAQPNSIYFKHNKNKPLIYDVLVIDEASMVDLALMAKCVDALKNSAKLILLGDKDQLASVESGAVLADLTQALPHNTVELKQAYRFNEHIKSFAEAINTQQAKKAWQLLNNDNEMIRLLPQHKMIDYIAEQYSHYLTLIKAQANFNDIFTAFNQFRVLCANRQGHNSVAEINYLVQQALTSKKQINLSNLWYVGRPIMVTQNNPTLHLYNGDIGLCLLVNNQLMVCFIADDGFIKSYSPARIPACETVFAMTIHKSQGSEFENLLIALPNTINRALTKELLYTAVTRAKSTIHIVTEKNCFMKAIEQKVERGTGLADKLITQVTHTLLL